MIQSLGILMEGHGYRSSVLEGGHYQDRGNSKVKSLSLEHGIQRQEVVKTWIAEGEQVRKERKARSCKSFCRPLIDVDLYLKLCKLQWSILRGVTGSALPLITHLAVWRLDVRRVRWAQSGRLAFTKIIQIRGNGGLGQDIAIDVEMQEIWMFYRVCQ